tara:strand:- start:403 stop:1467 length:1065 start_codon:yes stop_codon:yes gene_type:complete
MSEKEYDSLSKALASLYVDLGDIKSGQEEIPIGSVDGEGTRGVAMDNSRNPSVLNEQIYRPNLNTVYNTNNMKKTQESTFEPRENQKINVEIEPGLTTLENNLKENVIPVNLVDEPKENVTDKSKQSKETVVEKPTKFEFKSSNTLTDFLTGAEGFIPTVTEAIESKLNPKLDKTYDIGYGHKLTPEEYKSGLVYGIKVKDDKGEFITISKENALKILNEDIKEKARITKIEYENKTGKKFSDLSKTIQELLVESTFNGLSPKNAPGLTTAASKNDIKGIVDNMTDRYTGPKDNRVLLRGRNDRLWSSYLDKLSQNLSKPEYGKLKNLLKERGLQKKQSGGIVRDPYKREPRFI